MSIDDHGNARLNCVCKCRNGFRSDVSPAIHILAGENVCIHRINPTHISVALASRHSPRISSGVVSTGWNTTVTGIPFSFANEAAIACECCATCCNVSGPYRCWLPVQNQISSVFKSVMPARLSNFPL